LSRCSAPFEERRAFGLLYRSRPLDMNALELEHAKLGGRAAWRGKTANLSARGLPVGAEIADGKRAQNSRKRRLVALGHEPGRPALRRRSP
jgi:hypothetical protein